MVFVFAARIVLFNVSGRKYWAWILEATTATTIGPLKEDVSSRATDRRRATQSNATQVPLDHSDCFAMQGAGSSTGRARGPELPAPKSPMLNSILLHVFATFLVFSTLVCVFGFLVWLVRPFDGMKKKKRSKGAKKGRGVAKRTGAEGGEGEGGKDGLKGTGRRGKISDELFEKRMRVRWGKKVGSRVEGREEREERE